jgi:hypothetical protein
MVMGWTYYFYGLVSSHFTQLGFAPGGVFIASQQRALAWVPPCTDSQTYRRTGSRINVYTHTHTNAYTSSIAEGGTDKAQRGRGGRHTENQCVGTDSIGFHDGRGATHRPLGGRRCVAIIIPPVKRPHHDRCCPHPSPSPSLITTGLLMAYRVLPLATASSPQHNTARRWSRSPP